MGTAPSGYQTPKVDWAANNGVTSADFNRIEGNINAIETGSRTIDPAQVPSSNSGSLRQLLDWFANRIKAITGETNWYSTPVTTLYALEQARVASAENLLSHRHTGEGTNGPKLTHDAIDTANISAFRAYQSTAQSIPTLTWTKVAFQTEAFDQLYEYDVGTYRFAPLKAGIYLITAAVRVATYTADWIDLGVYVNGLAHSRVRTSNAVSGADASGAISVPVKLSAGDYVEIYTYLNASATLVAGTSFTFFMGVRLA